MKYTITPEMSKQAEKYMLEKQIEVFNKYEELQNILNSGDVKNNFEAIRVYNEINKGAFELITQFNLKQSESEGYRHLSMAFTFLVAHAKNYFEEIQSRYLGVKPEGK